MIIVSTPYHCGHLISVCMCVKYEQMELDPELGVITPGKSFARHPAESIVVTTAHHGSQLRAMQTQGNPAQHTLSVSIRFNNLLSFHASVP